MNALLRTIGGESPMDLSLRMLLLVFLVSGHVAGSDWYFSGPILAISAGALLLGRHAYQTTWVLLGALFLAKTCANYWSQDNHLFLATYACLAACWALRSDRPEAVLAASARLLVGFVFLFAVLWKGFLSPDYMSGGYFHYTFLTDPRFEGLVRLLRLLPEEAYAANVAAAQGLAQAGEIATLVTSESLRTLVQIITWWTVGIETLLALAFLAPRRTSLARGRDALLLVFAATTYLVAPVPSFGWLLLSLGVCQCTDARLRVGYVFVAGLLFLFDDGGCFAWLASVLG